VLAFLTVSIPILDRSITKFNKAQRSSAARIPIRCVMANILDGVQDTLLEGETRVRRGAAWFYKDFTCAFPSDACQSANYC
jgi:hypothetical protein